MERRLSAIFAADMVGYSRLMEADEIGTIERQKIHRKELIDPAFEKFHGRIVKEMGDGILVEFPSVVDAVSCALSIQRAMPERESRLNENLRITYRIGINLGDVIIEGEDLFGDGVNVAARLEQLAEPGGVCISGTVHDHIGGRSEFACSFMGERQLKNISRPVRAYRVSPSPDRGAEEPVVFSNRAMPDKPSIAVLPFDNMSGDPEQEYFSDGITEDIITDLSRISQLFVIARNSTFSYKGRSVKVQQISADLGAKFIVEGSVRRSGNRVRVTAQLVDGEKGGHVWAERYDRDLTDVFEVQDDIAKNIVEALKIAIAPAERRAIEKIPTQSPEAYDRYLRGRQLLHQMTKVHLERARELFLDAVALDPDFAVAFTGLADCHTVLRNFYSTDQGLIETAIGNSKKALELDPDLAEAHASLAYALMMGGDESGADREFKSAIDLDPMLYEAYWYYGQSMVKRGDLEEAAELFSRASAVRGDDLQSKMMLMTVYLGLGRGDDMRAIAKETYTIAARRVDLNPDDARAAYIGAQALIHLNDKPRALNLLNMAARIDTEDPRTAYNIACAYANLGEIDKALDLLEISINAGRPLWLLDWMKIDPDLTAVRDHPRFDALLTHWLELGTDAPPASAPASH